jgi:putative two-component system hydrogenase maturation factor HypX/HoxX
MQSVFAVQVPRAPVRQAPSCLRILFLVTAHNSLSQRIWAELTGLGHEVDVAVVDTAAQMEAAVAAHAPELIVCPLLKTMIPSSVWSTHRCLIVHPGPPGDRGPSSLDWAIELGAEQWGVTVLEADDEPDAGPVWASRSFAMRPAGKSSLYRHEVRRAATAAVREAVTRAAEGTPGRADDALSQAHGSPRTRPLLTQAERRIEWRYDRTETVVRRMRAAEGHPGVLDSVEGLDAYLFGVHHESRLRGSPGEIIAQRHGAICRATVDGAVWITHLKPQASSQPPLKLPATRALQLAGVELAVPEVPAPPSLSPNGPTYRDITYEEHAGVGRLAFDFYNGAMSTDQCRRLHDAYRYARSRLHTRVIVLCGGADFFSNGIHLNMIEAASDPGRESWENLRAIDDLVREIILTDSHLVIAALRGDAAAGGVPLALAADEVFARPDVVLNPYYGHMGGLYGSEYWTYLLPRRVGRDIAALLTAAPFTPLSAPQAVQVGLLDGVLGSNVSAFHIGVLMRARRLAADPQLDHRLERKRRQRTADEAARPLESYRRQELDRCHECFFGADRSYHEARRRFVYKLGAPCAVGAETHERSRQALGGRS